jgi:hypothetical protein
VLPIEMLCEAIVVQEVPLLDSEAVNVEPLRWSRTHRGGAPLAAVFVVEPFVDVRRWNAAPLPGEISAKAWREPAASDSRIITPALTHGSTFWMLATRATIVPSPVMLRRTNMN